MANMFLFQGSHLNAEEAADPQEAVARFESVARAMLNRMDGSLQTIRGVGEEPNPGRRLAILEGAVSSLAPDAAALISRGDGLLLTVHAADATLAERLSLSLEKLRAKWSQVMAETEVSYFDYHFFFFNSILGEKNSSSES